MGFVPGPRMVPIMGRFDSSTRFGVTGLAKTRKGCESLWVSNGVENRRRNPFQPWPMGSLEYTRRGRERYVTKEIEGRCASASTGATPVTASGQASKYARVGARPAME